MLTTVEPFAYLISYQTWQCGRTLHQLHLCHA